MNAGSGHVCVSRGEHRMFSLITPIFQILPLGKKEQAGNLGREDYLILPIKDSFWRLPLMPTYMRDLFIMGRNIIYNFIRNLF